MAYFVREQGRSPEWWAGTGPGGRKGRWWLTRPNSQLTPRSSFSAAMLSGKFNCASGDIASTCQADTSDTSDLDTLCRLVMEKDATVVFSATQNTRQPHEMDLTGIELQDHVRTLDLCRRCAATLLVAGGPRH